MVSADSARALGQAVDDQIFLRAVDLAAAHAHRVDHRHAAGGDIVAVAHPAGGLPADRLAKVGAGLPDQPEQRLGFARHRLGRPAEAAMDVDLDVMLGGDRGDRRLDQRLRLRLVLGRRRAQIDPQDREVGHDIVRPAAVDPRRIDAQPRILAPVFSRSARSAAATRALRPSSGLRPAWAERPWTMKREIAAARPRAGQRPVGQRGRLVGQRGALAPRRRGDQRGRARRADLLVAVDDDFIAERVAAPARLDRLQRREHHRDAALHVGDARPAEHAVLAATGSAGTDDRRRTPCPCGR